MSVLQPQVTRAGDLGRGFQPALEGVRALAAIGVLTTHVAFQTGSVRSTFPGPVWGRFDMAVALFFALSGFLLWRPHAFAAADGGPGPAVGRYLRHRVLRIWPAYVVVVVVVLTLLPEARGASASVWLANLSLTQVFVPLSLTAGLTQMWSLSVEVAFYLVLPLIGWMLCRLRGGTRRWRIPILLTVAVVALGWGAIADRLPVAAGVEPKNWLPGLLPWFIAGMLLAELCASGAGSAASGPSVNSRAFRWFAARWVMWPLALLMFALSCTHLAGPTGLVAVTAGQYTVKTALGAVLGFAVLAPLVFTAPSRDRLSDRLLTSGPLQALGRWSYGIFIWHLVILEAVFPAFGIVPFSGSMLSVWLLTVAGTVVVSAVSYSWIESPTRDWLRRRESARRAATSSTTAAVTVTASAVPANAWIQPSQPE